MHVGIRSRDEDLARAVKQVQWQHHRRLDARMRTLGSTIVQWDVLRALEADPRASAHDLAVATFQSDQSLGMTMRRMEDRGLVERATPRGRRFEHRITPRGQELLEEGHRAAAEIFSHSFGRLTDDEHGALLALLKRVGDIASGPGTDHSSRSS